MTRSLRGRWIVPAAAALAVLLGLGGAWYLGPWGREFRLSRASLLSLDAETVRRPSDAVAWYYLGKRLEEKGDYWGAEAALRQALQARPDDPRVMVALGSVVLRRNAVPEAFQLARASQGRDPASIPAKVLLGRLYQRTGAYHKAVDQWREVTQRQPGNSDAWYFLGYCYLQMQQVDNAIASADRALRLKPRDPAYLRLRGSIAAARGDLSAARQYYEAAVAADPGDARSHNDLANFLLTQSRSPEDIRRAEAAVREVARLAPAYPMLSWHRARLAAARQEWNTAVRELHETLRTTPGLVEAHFALANAYYRAGQQAKGDAAMAEYRRQSELNRRMDELLIRIQVADAPGLHFELGRVRREMGQLDRAREAIEQGLQMAPGSPEGRAELKKLDELRRRGRGKS